MEDFWQTLQLNPELTSLMILTVFLVVAWVVDHLFGMYFLRWTKKTKTQADDLIVSTIRKPVYWSVVLVGGFMALTPLSLSVRIDTSVSKVVWSLGIILWSATLVQLFRVFSGVIEKKVAQAHGMIDSDLVPFLDRLAQVVVLVLAVMFLLSLWGIDVTPLLASAGVAGFAVAFAAKDTVGNLFGGLSIFLDRPYRVGDYVIMKDGYRGEVTEIGMRSTRVRTRDNVMVTVPNSVMVTDAVVNETGFDPKLRIRLPLSVAYGTDLERVEKILVKLTQNHKQIIDSPLPIVRFREFGDSGIKLELLALIKQPADRGRILHELIMLIHKSFMKEGISIPFPQRDLHVVEYKKGKK